MSLLAWLDLALALGLALRLTRFIVLDDLGLWWVRGPITVRASDAMSEASEEGRPWPRWAKYVSGLSCPWCVGFWIGVLALGTLALAGGPGHAHEVWRYVAGAFTLNYLAAHIGVRLGDTEG